ncbi:MAG: PIN domain-containing protein [Candidatus Levybacteria bacterium]|nr:PIN domain-containing protein [Candidatus Levybacteria bacterium]
MQIIFDTSALIRFFSDDNPRLADKVEKLIEQQQNIQVPDVVFPELEYVLTKQYKSPKAEVLKAYQFLQNQRNIKKSPYIDGAIEIFENTNLDMADCIIAAQSMKGKLASFDEDMLKIKGVNAFWK